MGQLKTEQENNSRFSQEPFTLLYPAVRGLGEAIVHFAQVCAGSITRE
jgi:hypothetical protein